MKKKFMKIIAMALTLASLFTFAAPAIADRGEIVDGWGEDIPSTVQEELPKEIFVTKTVEHGTRSIASEISPETAIATLTKYDRIYQLDNGEYLELIDKYKVLSLKKIEINLKDNLDVIEQYEFPKEVLDDLTEKKRQVDSGELTIGEISVFESHSVDVNDRNPLAEFEYNYVYNGSSMRRIRISYSNLATPMSNIVYGSGAKDYASAISSLIVDGASYVPVLDIAMSIYGSATNLKSAYQQATGSWPLEGGRNDFIQTSVNYDHTSEYIYRYTPVYNYYNQLTGYEWRLGLTTAYAYIYSITTVQYYVSGYRGNRYTTYAYPKKAITTPSYYSNTSEIAYNNAYGNYSQQEFLSYRVPGTNHRIRL